MKRAAGVIVLLVLLGLAFGAGSWYSRRPTDQRKLPPTRTVLYYIDPMNPGFRSDKPGIAPCGMDLVPVYADAVDVGAGARPASVRPGTIAIARGSEQRLGVRVAAVERARVTHPLRALGRVAPHENRTYRILAATDGWIQDLQDVTTGSLISKDEPLGSFYSPEFIGAQQAYFYALNALDRIQASGRETPDQFRITNISIQQARTSLRNLGMSDGQLDELARTRTQTQQILLVAPAAGFVVARNVSPGQRFERGTELYRIADLRRVWILVDVFESDDVHLRPGMRVRMTLPNKTESLVATVGAVLPQFDETSRTVKVRLEADNPGLILRPGMFVDVELPIPHAPALVVPIDAVVDRGAKQIVYVEQGDGVFEPRRVETGWRHGNQVEIVKGLMPGERIVVSGTFLIDSESRMKTTAASTFHDGTSVDPICGMEVDQGRARAAGHIAEYHGKTYYFCSEDCKVKFETAARSTPTPKGEVRQTSSSLKDAKWDGAFSPYPPQTREVSTDSHARTGHR